ncbi:hypothetical protein ACHAQA_009057 [Verticillium albo-atrum]
MPDSTDGLDEGLESSKSSAPWDQFAENERRFGIKTDYDENIYTTAINKNHPQYREPEERIMDFAGGDDRGGDEEDKYSGVRRQDFPALSNRENKYMPPAKRAPAAQSTVSGAPIDPAIISSQVRATNKKPPPAKSEDNKTQTGPIKPLEGSETDSTKVDSKSATKSSPKDEILKAVGVDTAEKPTEGSKLPDVKQADKTSTPLRTPATSGRAKSPQAASKEGTPSAALTVERDVLNSFKSFATQQRQNADKIRTSKAKADKEVKLTELKKFAQGFKLSTPVPTDLISIIAKDPSKQKEIQAKALQNAEDVARTKTVEPVTKDKDAKDVSNKQTATGTTVQVPLALDLLPEMPTLASPTPPLPTTASLIATTVKVNTWASRTVNPSARDCATRSSRKCHNLRLINCKRRRRKCEFRPPALQTVLATLHSGGD